MKKIELLKEANEQVTKYLNNGWLLNWGNSSFGYEFMAEVVKGNNKIRIYIETTHYRFCNYIYTLKVVELDLNQTFEEKDQPALMTKVFYQIDEDWFTTSGDAAADIEDLRNQRYLATKKQPGGELPISDKLIAMLKKRKGFEKATRKNIAAVKSSRNGKYIISIKNRVGRVTNTLTLS